MAAILQTTIKKYVGTSVERIALVTTNLKVGSLFEQSDGKTYEWDGSAWFLKYALNVQVGSADVSGANPLPVSVGAGSSIIGKVSIDQTTPGTTNGIQVNAELPSGTNKIGSINIRNNANDANIDPLAESTFTARIGEVQESPTSNTVLGRLKDLLTSIVIAAGSNIIGKVGIDQTTDGTTNKVQARNATHDDFNLNANMQVGNTDVSTTNQMPVKYTLKKISTNFTRPANTNAYAVGDAITNSTSAPVVFQLDLSSIGAVVGQSFEIKKLAVVSSAKQSVLPLVNVYLSPTTFTATNDNSALDIDDTTMEAGGAWFQCDTQNYTASNSRTAITGICEPMILAVADTKLYGTMQAANAYTPVSGEKLTVIAWIALL
jgi:hypothetical protein